MVRLVCLLVAVLSLSQVGLAQSDYDDSAPVQSGYAVVTPSSSSQQFSVVETFSLKSGTSTTLAGMPAPNLVTGAVVFVDVSSRLNRNLGLAIANPNNAAASVTLTLRKTDGSQLATKTISINGRSQLVQFITDALPIVTSSGFGGSQTLSEYTGDLTISSTLPVSMYALRFRDSNFSALPLSNPTAATTPFPAMSQGVGGSGAVLLPQFASGGGWATQIVVMNPGSSSLTVRVDLFNQNGTAMTAALNRQRASSFPNMSVPNGGVLVLAPLDSNGDSRF